jgi:hypothetical protein
LEAIQPQKFGWAASDSTWRHIYVLLTIAIALRDAGAFDRFLQHPIKVDGTFA